MTPPDDAVSETLHASCVAVGGRGVLILGPSGSGKSGLALRLMAVGASLVADDRTVIARRGDSVIATCPEPLAGLIEARGVGLLRAVPAVEAHVALVVDLAQTETERLPPQRSITLLGCPLSLVLGSRSDHFTAAIRQYLLQGRQA